MKKVLQVLFTVLITISVNAQTFKVVKKADFEKGINSICFSSATNVWCLGDSSDAVLYKSIDAGSTWSKVMLPVVRTGNKVVFTDANNGFVFLASSKTGQAYMVRTTDGGATWKEVSLNSYYKFVISIQSVSFTSALKGNLLLMDKKVGTTTTSYYHVLNTTDGGLTWVKRDSVLSTTAGWFAMSFGSENNGVIVTNKLDGNKYTTDGGNTWQKATSLTAAQTFRTVCGVDANTFIAMGDGNLSASTPMFRSTNGGKDWSTISFKYSQQDKIKDIKFKDANNGVAIGYDKVSTTFIMTTTDAGATWTKKMLPYASSTQEISCSGSTLIGYTAGSQIVKSTDFGATWNYLNNNANITIRGLQYIADKWYAVDAYGNFFKSSDIKGTSFISGGKAGTNETYDMAFVSADKGYLVKTQRKLDVTSNGGAAWGIALDSLAYNSNNRVFSLKFIDANTGFIYGTETATTTYVLYKTVDGGSTWTKLPAIPAFTATTTSGDAAFFDAQNGVIATKLYSKYTSDGGTTWNVSTVKNVPTAFAKKYDIKRIAVVDASRAIAVGTRFMAVTTDKGATWTYVDHKIADKDSSFQSVAFNGNNGVATTFNGVIATSTDGGATWKADKTFENQYYLSVAAISPSGKAFVGTTTGAIIGDVPADANENNKITPNKFELKGNYPNPFNPTTNIVFNIPSKMNVTLKVYNVLGREVATLVNGERQGGENVVKFDASNLASGIYMYQIKAGNFTATQKMLLVK